MSEVTDCKLSAGSASRKRRPSPGQDEGSALPLKSSKVSDDVCATEAASESCKNSESENKEASQVKPKDAGSEDASQRVQGSDSSRVQAANRKDACKPHTSGTKTSVGSKKEKEKTSGSKQRPLPPQSDTAAAIAAAEALASLTGGDGEDSQETPCSSGKAKQAKHGSKSKQRGGHQSSKAGSKTQAAAADSSTSARSADKEAGEDVPEAEEGDESGSGSSSTPSSSFPSDNDNDDGECAIVSVKMAPEMRQSVALLAQVQMRLEALEKKSARLHQRLELKINRQRRPHLDQRSSITKTIPGFWVTAVSFKMRKSHGFFFVFECLKCTSLVFFILTSVS